jgi:hypothetical protein
MIRHRELKRIQISNAPEGQSRLIKVKVNKAGITLTLQKA